MCQATLSRLVPVAALVSRYLTNKLMGGRPVPDRRTFDRHSRSRDDIIKYYQHFR